VFFQPLLLLVVVAAEERPVAQLFPLVNPVGLVAALVGDLALLKVVALEMSQQRLHLKETMAEPLLLVGALVAEVVRVLQVKMAHQDNLVMAVTAQLQQSLAHQ
jgi:hypothetical protein